MSGEERFCRDCRWGLAQPRPGLFQGPPEWCRHPKVVAAKTDLVRGHMMTSCHSERTGEYRLALPGSTQRHPMLCGPEGALYERRLSLLDRIKQVLS